MKTLIYTLLFLFLSTNANAFYCGPGKRKIASEGMSKYEIRKNCGRPVHKEVSEISERKRGRNKSIRFKEEWVYEVKEYGRTRQYLIKFDRDGNVESTDYIGEVPGR